jgi:hypothetical protein
MSALVTAVGPVAFAASAGSQNDPRFNDSNLAALDNLSLEFFEPWLGAKFKASSPARQTTLTLISAAGFPAEPAGSSASTPPNRNATGKVLSGLPPEASSGAKVKGFSLRFQGSGSILPQDTYTLSNSAVGIFSVFLVPCGKAGAAPAYTAIFAYAP